MVEDTRRAIRVLMLVPHYEPDLGASDVFTDVGVAPDIFRTKSVIAVVSGLERSCLTNSMVVSMLSDSF